MTLVVDASVAVRWLFDLAGATQADALLQSQEPLIAPDLVFSEIANAAWKMVLFGALPSEAATESVRKSSDFFHEIIPSGGLKDTALAIGLELRHPVYGCFYLALAQQRDCQMVTADDKLLTCCAGTAFAKRVGPLVSARSGRRR
jgi:predicted nucleic acid-binding protein